MKPDLEVVDVLQHESFKVWGHGYPFRTVRWHFHPEFEIQLITETSGQYFVGEFDGVTFRSESTVPADTGLEPGIRAELERYDWLDWGSDYYAAVSFFGTGGLLGGFVGGLTGGVVGGVYVFLNTGATAPS